MSESYFIDSTNSSYLYLNTDYENRKKKEVFLFSYSFQLLIKINQFHSKENEWKKEKAIYDQKIELLENQIKEGKSREKNLEKMIENLSSALNDFANSKTNTISVKIKIKKKKNEFFFFQIKGFEDLKYTLEKNLKEFSEYKLNSNDQLRKYEHEVIFKILKITNFSLIILKDQNISRENR